MSCSVPVELLLKRRSVDLDAPRPPRNRLKKYRRISSGQDYDSMELRTGAAGGGHHQQHWEWTLRIWPRLIRDLRR